MKSFFVWRYISHLLKEIQAADLTWMKSYMSGGLIKSVQSAPLS